MFQGSYTFYTMILLIGICMILLKASSVDANCSENCLPSPNGTVTCNETTEECLYGCQEGFNCTNCTTESDNENCLPPPNGTVLCNETNEECLYGCQEGFEGPLCNIESEMNSTNCTLKSDSENCLPPPNGTVLCNETTEECLHGCQEGFTGSLCNITCVRNCSRCTLKADSSLSETQCEQCQEGYFQNKGNCDSCSEQCLRNESSSLPVCRQADAVCEFGCIDGYYNHTCNSRCSSTCKDVACERPSGKCTHGCEKNTLTGDRCVYSCNQGCVLKQCEQDRQCIHGCYANYWGTTCEKTCNQNCAKVSDPDTNPCDEGDGHCVFGCTDNKWWGETCTQSCSVYCKGGLCQNSSGACINGCETNTMFGSDCSKTCSLNCQNGTCLVANGVCIGGCIPGWFGETCDKTCPENCVDNLCFVENGTCAGGCKSGWFGQTCSSQCSDQCANRTCYVETGECFYGCNHAYTGFNCSERLEMVLPEPTDTKWIYIVSGCGAFVALCIVVAVICYSRKRQRVDRRRRVKSIIDGQPLPRRGRAGILSEVFTENPLASYIKKRVKGKPEDSETIPTRIRVEELLDHVLNMDANAYNDEFEKLETDQLETKKHLASRQIENLAKNFYDGIYPYDDNRVVLQLENLPGATQSITDYINASHIRGYRNVKRYIAAQGPSKVTAYEFWRMVWEQNSNLIVMLTVIPEDGSSQYTKYWPDMGELKYLDTICICTIECNVFAEFTVRKFKLSFKNEDRFVQHIHFTYWPDHGPPPEAADMIEFHQKYRSMVKSRDSNGPIVVHCTAGVGRTGVFIALDLLMDEGLVAGSVNVFACVSRLRNQRVNMVQTCEQYEFLYKTIAQTLALQCQFKSKSDFPTLVGELHKLQDDGQSKMEQIFKNCDASLRLDDVYIESISGFQERHVKDRPTSVIPELRYRPMLLCHEYINAVCVDTYKRKDGMIVTQMPTPDTIEDFYKLAIQKDCGIIVMLNKVDPGDKTCGIYWPSDKKVTKHGDIQVTLTQGQIQDDYSVLHLTFEDDQTKGFANQMVHQLKMIQYKGWEHVHKLPNVHSFLGFIKIVKEHMDTSSNSKLLVHCLNGSEQTGLFCVLYNLLEKLECEDDIGVVSIVRKLKTRRPSVIPDMGQFEYCHDAVMDYLNQVLDNTNGKPVYNSNGSRAVDNSNGNHAHDSCSGNNDIMCVRDHTDENHTLDIIDENRVHNSTDGSHILDNIDEIRVHYNTDRNHVHFNSSGNDEHERSRENDEHKNSSGTHVHFKSSGNDVHDNTNGKHGADDSS